MTGELQSYRLDRTGRPPLAFEGEFLAGAYGSDYIGEKARGRNPRWHDLELYRTAGGGYVLAVRYHSEWRHKNGDVELGFDEAHVVTSVREVLYDLEHWDPTAPVVGYPPGAQFVKKQERLLAEVRARFDACVSELLGQLGPEFAERVG